MMPLFTPELDTYIGGERPTTQLVDITVETDGSYSFNFDKVGRWIDMCLACGVESTFAVEAVERTHFAILGQQIDSQRHAQTAAVYGAEYRRGIYYCRHLFYSLN